jgi:hypothetical protein
MVWEGTMLEWKPRLIFLLIAAASIAVILAAVTKPINHGWH